MTIPALALNDGRTIPQLGFGVWKVPADEAERVVVDAFEAGYRHIDTASLYLIHWPRPDADRYVEAWQALIELRDGGLARSIGVSNLSPRLLGRLIAETGVVPAVNQVELHPAYAQRELRDYAAAQGIAIECWGPLGQGKYPLFDYPAIVSAAEAHGTTPARVVLAWHLAHGLVPLPKTVSAARMVENAGAADLRLSVDQLAAIDALDVGLRLGADPEQDVF